MSLSICAFGFILLHFYYSYFFALQTHIAFICSAWKFSLNCAQHAYTVFSSLRAWIAAHYTHDANTSRRKTKLFLDVLRTWKQLRFESGCGGTNNRKLKHTRTHKFDSFVFILVWWAEQTVKCLYFDEWSSFHCEQKKTLKKTNRSWNEWVPLKVKQFQAVRRLSDGT